MKFSLKNFNNDSDDCRDWNKIVMNNPDSNFYDMVEWGEIYNEVYGYQKLFYFVEDEKGIIDILNLMHYKGIMKDFLAPVQGSFLNGVGELLNYKLQFIAELLKENHIEMAKFSTKCKFANDWYLTTGNVSVLLPLPESKEELFTRIGSKKRNMVRKGEKNRLVFEVFEDINDGLVEEFYKIYAQNYRDLGTPVHSKHFFYTQLKYLRKNIRLVLVKLDAKNVGTMWLHCYKDTISDPEAATLRSYAHLGVSDFMYWHAFVYSVENGYAVFNMGRSQINSGTYHFKKNFVSSEVLNQYDYSTMQVLNLQKKKKKMTSLISIWKSLPVSVTNFFGPISRKHLDI